MTTFQKKLINATDTTETFYDARRYTAYAIWKGLATVALAIGYLAEVMEKR